MLTGTGRNQVLAAAIAAVALAAPAAAHAADGQSVTFEATGEHAFTVPPGVATLDVVAVGGAGGGGGGLFAFTARGEGEPTWPRISPPGRGRSCTRRSARSGRRHCRPATGCSSW